MSGLTESIDKGSCEGGSSGEQEVRVAYMNVG